MTWEAGSKGPDHEDENRLSTRVPLLTPASPGGCGTSPASPGGGAAGEQVDSPYVWGSDSWGPDPVECWWGPSGAEGGRGPPESGDDAARVVQPAAETSWGVSPASHGGLPLPPGELRKLRSCEGGGEARGHGVSQPPCRDTVGVETGLEGVGIHGDRPKIGVDLPREEAEREGTPDPSEGYEDSSESEEETVEYVEHYWRYDGQKINITNQSRGSRRGDPRDPSTRSPPSGGDRRACDSFCVSPAAFLGSDCCAKVICVHVNDCCRSTK